MGTAGTVSSRSTADAGSEVDVKPKHLDDDRSAVSVVARMIDALQTGRDRESTPEAGRIVGFDDVFAAVAERAVAEEEPLAAEPQILAVRRRQTVGDDRDAEPILRSLPRSAGQIAAAFDAVVHFRVG